MIDAKHIVTSAANLSLSRDRHAFERTKQLVADADIPVIYQAVLHNHNNKTFGVVDLLVRNDYLSVLFPRQQFEESRLPPHYVVIDIKFSTLNAKADGEHLLNQNNVAFHKSQLCIYNDALATIQKIRPEHAYVLGRRFRSKNKFVNDAFYRLGKVSFEGSDKSVVKSTESAVNWLKELRENGNDWSMLPRPSRPELYPNMKQQAYSHNKTKRNWGEKLAEITSVWQCGIRRRQKAHSKGVYRWDDPRCTAKLMGMSGTTGQTVDRMLQLNRDTNRDVISLHSEKLLRSNFQRSEEPVELFLDFESVTDVFFDIAVPHTSFIGNLLFMAGIGEMKNGKWDYRPFYAKTLTKKSEGEMIVAFFHHLEKYRAPVTIYHWGRIERVELDRAMRQHSIMTPVDFKLVDLCDRVRSAQLVFRGAFGFGLKAIARSLVENGAIPHSLYWKESSLIRDGMDAMVQLMHRYKEGDNISKLDIMEDMESYNNTDCRMVYEVLRYTRGLLINERKSLK